MFGIGTDLTQSQNLSSQIAHQTTTAVDELMSLSSFTRKSLLYLCIMVTLAIYLKMIARRK